MILRIDLKASYYHTIEDLPTNYINSLVGEEREIAENVLSNAITNTLILL